MKSCAQLCVPVGQLPENGLTVTVDVAFAALDIEDTERIACPERLQVQLHIARVGHEILARGELHSTLVCHCDRCLETYRHPVATADVCHLVEEPADLTIDLTEAIREDILLVFPEQCLCRPECRGLCPHCGQNLNAGQCACATRETRRDAWGVLDHLHLQIPPEDELKQDNG